MTDKEILRAEIKALYTTFDRKFGLNGASLPIEFGNDEEKLGAYVKATEDEGEHFFFSLLFISYSASHQVSKADREDIYKHEYAHYMQHHMEIPKEYTWQAGVHGSAWKYCCSLVEAVPSPYYKVGEALKKHDYDSLLKNSINDKSVPVRDVYRREQEYRKQKNTKVQFEIGDEIVHPKFGSGKVVEIESTDKAVRIHLSFDGEIKVIDQQWLLKLKYQKRY